MIDRIGIKACIDHYFDRLSQYEREHYQLEEDRERRRLKRVQDQLKEEAKDNKHKLNVATLKKHLKDGGLTAYEGHDYVPNYHPTDREEQHFGY